MLACLVYVPMVGAIYGAPAGDPGNDNGEDRYGLGWIELWAMFFGAQLWLALGGMLLCAGRSGRMPVWARGWVVILHIAAAITLWAVLRVYIDSDGGVSIVVPTLVPLLIAGYAAAMRLPAVSERLSPDRASGVALCAGAILIAAAVPLGLLDLHNLPAHIAADAARLDARIAAKQAESDDRRAVAEAHFKTLTPDSPLEEYVRYVRSTDPNHPEHAVALAGARLVKSRQADAIQMLDDGEITRLWELWQFDLQATPALCGAYDRALHRVATSDDVYDWNVGELIKYQLPNIKFFAAAHCNLNASLTAAEVRVGKIIAANPGDTAWRAFLAILLPLHQNS